MAPERRGRVLILDTSVIREAATWNAVYGSRMQSLAGELRFLRTPASYSLLANFRRRFVECIVPSGVYCGGQGLRTTGLARVMADVG